MTNSQNPEYFSQRNTRKTRKTAEEFSHEGAESTKKQPQNFLGGNSRKQRAPPILLCVSVPLRETPSAVVDSLRSLRSLRQMRLPLGTSRRVLAPKNAKSAEKQPQNFWGEQPKTTSPSYSALCLCASARDAFGCCRLRDSEREGFPVPTRRDEASSRLAGRGTPAIPSNFRGVSAANGDRRKFSNRFRAGGQEEMCLFLRDAPDAKGFRSMWPLRGRRCGCPAVLANSWSNPRTCVGGKGYIVHTQRPWEISEREGFPVPTRRDEASSRLAGRGTPAIFVCFKEFRRERDLNPRPACAGSGFQDRRVRPLRHLSTLPPGTVAHLPKRCQAANCPMSPSLSIAGR